MDTLILYISKHGTTETIAQLLAERLGKNNCRLLNLKKESPSNIEDYQNIIIGGSIHIGGIPKKLKTFLENHQSLLLQKTLGLYLCCMFKDEKAEEQFQQAFPEALRNHAKALLLPGGELKLERMNFLEKLAVKKVAGATQSQSDIDKSKIDAFVKAFIC